MNGYFRIIFIVILILSVMTVVNAQSDSTLNLQELIDKAVLNNPRLRGAALTVRADSQTISQAGALPDPMLGLHILNVPVDNFVFDQEAMTGKQIALKQGIPFPGKLGLKEKIAEDRTRISLWNEQEIRNKLINDVKIAYYNLYYVDRAIATITKNQDLLTQFVDIAQTRYAVGKGLQQDVLKAQVELSRMTERLINLRQTREKIESKLNTLLNRPVEEPLPSTPPVTFRQVEAPRDTLSFRALHNRPLIKAWQIKIAQSRKKTDLAHKNYWPDFGISLAYTQRDPLQNGMGGVDFLSGGISLNLPVYFWKKQKKAVQESTIRSRAVEEGYQQIHNQILQALDDAYTDWQKNGELAVLYRDGIVPQAAQSLQSAMIGYQTDKVDFLTLINNQMTLLNLELEYVRIVSDYQKNLAQLEYITGQALVEE